MKKLTFYLLTLLFFKIGYTKNIDSLLMVKVHAVFDSIYNQNYINDTKGLSELNNYLIDINTDEFNTYEVNEFLNTKVFADDDANTIKAMTTSTKAYIQNKLNEINNRTKAIGTETYYGVQFYLLLISGIPISMEKNLPEGMSLHEAISNYNGKQLERLQLITKNGKTINLDGSKNSYEDLIKASSNVINELSTIHSDVKCKMIPQINSYLKKPFYVFSIADFIITNNYTNTTNNAALKLNKEIKRVNVWYGYKEGVSNKIVCTSQPNNIYEYDNKVMNAFKALHSYFLKYRTYSSTEELDKSDLKWKEVIDYYIKGFGGAQYNYLNMLDVAVQADALIDKTYNCINSLKTFVHPTNQEFRPNNMFKNYNICGCMQAVVPIITNDPFYDHPFFTLKTDLVTKLEELDITSIGMFNTEQKIKLLKILGSPNDNEAFRNGDVSISNIITAILNSVNSELEGQYFTQELVKNNEISLASNYTLLACLDKIVKNDKLDADGKLNGEPYMMEFNNSIVNVFRWANKSFIENPESFFNLDETKLAEKLFVYNNSLISDANKRFKYPNTETTLELDKFPAGSTFFNNGLLNPQNGKIRVIKKTLQHYCNITEQQSEYITSTNYSYSPLVSGFGAGQDFTSVELGYPFYTGVPQYTSEVIDFNPFDWVILQDISLDNMDMMSATITMNSDKKNNFFIAPAYILKYPYEISHSIDVRKFNNKIDRSVELSLDMLAFVLPELKLVQILTKVNKGVRVVKAANYIRKAALLLNGLAATTKLTEGFFNGWGAERSNFSKLIDKTNALVQLGYIGISGIDFVAIKLGAGTYLEKSAEFITEISKPGIYSKIKAKFLDNSTPQLLKNECELILNLKETLDFAAKNIFKKSKYWFLSYRPPSTALIATHPYQKFFTTGYFFEEKAGNIIKLFSREKNFGNRVLIAECTTDGQMVIDIKNTVNAIPQDFNEFQLIEKVNSKIVGNTTIAERNFIVAKGASGACVLPSYCFVGSTLVLTPTGAVPFDQLQDGTPILSYNSETKTSLTQTIGRIVRSTTNKLVKIFVGGEVLMATPEHPLYQTNQGWTLAGSLRKGMSLLLATGLSLSIDSVAAIDTTCTVYNCDVPLTHTYYVGYNGLLAHNANVCNKLVVAVLNKLGAGYDAAGVKTALETIFEKYALKFSGATSAIKEEQAIAELSKLCSQSISKTNLENLLKYIGTDAAKASTFANDLEKYALLDDFAKDGRLLENYISVIKKDYTNFKLLAGSKENFIGFYNFLNSLHTSPNYLELGNLVGKVGSYEKFANGEVFYRIMEQKHYERLLKGEGLISSGETFTSPTLDYIKAKKWDGVIVKIQVKPGTLNELKSRAIINDQTTYIQDIFGATLPQQAGSVNDWTKRNYAMFKTEKFIKAQPILEEIQQVNIGLGSENALIYFNNNIINFQIIK